MGLPYRRAMVLPVKSMEEAGCNATEPDLRAGRCERRSAASRPPAFFLSKCRVERAVSSCGQRPRHQAGLIMGGERKGLFAKQVRRQVLRKLQSLSVADRSMRFGQAKAEETYSFFSMCLK